MQLHQTLVHVMACYCRSFKEVVTLLASASQHHKRSIELVIGYLVYWTVIVDTFLLTALTFAKCSLFAI